MISTKISNTPLTYLLFQFGLLALVEFDTDLFSRRVQHATEGDALDRRLTLAFASQLWKLPTSESELQICPSFPAEDEKKTQQVVKDNV